MPVTKPSNSWRPDGTYDKSLTSVSTTKVTRTLGLMPDMRKRYPEHVVTDEQKAKWNEYWEKQLSWWDDCVRQRVRETWDHPSMPRRHGPDQLF